MQSRRHAVTTAAAIVAGQLFSTAREYLFTDNQPAATPPTAAPPVDYVDKLRAEMFTLKSEADATFAAATAENRPLSPEELAETARKAERMKAINETIEARAKFAALALSDAAPTVTTPREPPGRQEFTASAAGRQPPGKIDPAAFALAFTAWGSTGQMAPEFATITTATASGAMLPKSIGMPLVPSHANAFRQALALWGLQPVETQTTAALTIPVMTASAGGVVAQNASSETENEPSLTGSIVLDVLTYQSGSAWFSNQQLNAVDFDLSAYVTQDLTYAKEQGLEAAIAAAIIADAGITQAVTSATTTGFTYANLVDLNRALPRRYDRQKVIFLGAAAYAAAEKLVGDDGHPILNRDPQNQELLRFNGTPVLRCDNFEGLTANKTIGAIASMAGLRLRDVAVQELARYTQNSARPGQTGFNLIGYHGYGWDDNAVAKLKTAAS